MRQRTLHGPPRAPRGLGPRSAPGGRRAAGAGRGPLNLRRGIVLACAAAALPLAVGTGAWAAPGVSGERDVHLVYCLAASHRAGLVGAAEDLGLLRPGAAGQDAVRPPGAGGPMTLEQWSRQHEKDFERACTALMAADAASSAGPAPAQDQSGDSWFVAFLKGLPPLAAGALLTLGGQSFERVSAERRQLTQQLAADQAAYRTAATAYLAAYERDAGADHTAVGSARETLVGSLTRVTGPRARCRAAERISDGLPLGRALPTVRGGNTLGLAARADESERAKRTADQHLRATADLDRGRLYWSWRTLRERRADRTAQGVDE
jgi:hypothetical protein